MAVPDPELNRAPSKKIEFADLTRVLTREPVELIGSPTTLKRPSVRPFFVEPTLTAAESDALAAEVLLIEAAAAVGKSTLAETLAYDCSVPLFDMTEVQIGAHTLRGALDAEVPSLGSASLANGDYVVIIDALDEGRLVQGEADLLAFVSTVGMLLATNRSNRDRPKLVMIGRHTVVADTEEILKTYCDSLAVSRLSLDYFEKEPARKLIREYGRRKALERAEEEGRAEDEKQPPYLLPGNDQLIDDAVTAYFLVLAKGLGFADAASMWEEPVGRGFAGYAPLLQTIGELLAATENFQNLANDFLDIDKKNAFEIIELLARRVMERDRSEKVEGALASEFGRKPPKEAYDELEQYELLCNWVQHHRLRLTRRMEGALKREHCPAPLYIKIIERFIDVHPFVRGNEFTNGVIAALVLARAIEENWLTDDARTYNLLREASREPFLWRAFRSRMMTAAASDESLFVDGRHLGYVLASLTNDVAESVDTRIHGSDEDLVADFKILGAGRYEVQVAPPLRLYGRAHNCYIDATTTLQCWGFAREASVKSLRLRDVTVNVNELHVDTDFLYLSGRIWIEAKHIYQPAYFEVPPPKDSDATLGWGGKLQGLWPWRERATRLVHQPETRPDDSLYDLLELARRRLLHGGLIVLNDEFNIPEGSENAAWNALRRSYGQDAMRNFWRLLVECNLMTTRRMESSSSRGRQYVLYLSLNNVSWDDIIKARLERRGGDHRITHFLESAEDLLADSLLKKR